MKKCCVRNSSKPLIPFISCLQERNLPERRACALDRRPVVSETPLCYLSVHGYGPFGR